MSAALQRTMAADIASYSLDPLAFVRYAFPWGRLGTPLEDSTGPREWQASVLRDIGKRLRAGYSVGEALMPVLQAVSSGHGVGKSSLVAFLTWWALSTCEDARVVLTANTESQLRTKTLPEMAKWHQMLICRDWFVMRGISIHSTQLGHERTWRCDAVTWSLNQLEAFAGLHNKEKRIVLLFDEASGIDDRVWEVAEGALTDANTEIIWCVFGNPTQPQGRFFECFGRLRHRWHGTQIDSRTVPGTNLAQFATWVEDYGEDSDFVRVRVRGVFPRAGSSQFIGTDLVDAAAKREAAAILTDALVLGVDVARFGSDQSVIWFRKGRDARSIPPIKLRGVDTMQLAARVVDEARRWNADGVFIDETGIGAGVVDRCRQLKLEVVGVNNGSTADRATFDADATKYANKGAEMWGNLREWLKGGAIPDDVELVPELTGRQYGFSADNAIQLERKDDMRKRGLASPDNADALALTFAYPVQPNRMAGGLIQAQQAKARVFNPHPEE